MKKYITAYIVILVGMILLIFSKGIPWKIEVAFIQQHLIDGFSFTVYLLPGNLMIAAVTLLALIIITCLPSNRVPGKWLILIAGIVLIGFVPQVYERIGGGVMGGIRDAYFNLFMIPQEVFRLTHMPF
ncbi:MAG: hypothetical protein K6B69_02795 [Lachnospiraceae bacterium]|nr:hypothetical protein [Lachnospiraceae bacterium]